MNLKQVIMAVILSAAAVLSNPVSLPALERLPTIRGLVNGVEIEVNGTIQDFHASASAIDSSYVAPTSTPVKTSPELSPRGTPLPPSCWPTSGPASKNQNKPAGYDASLGVVNNLEKGGSNVLTIGPGPNACYRVSCVFGAGVWVCNNTAGPINYLTMNDVGRMAQTIKNYCMTDGLKQVTLGQDSDSDGGFSVVLKWSDCKTSDD